MSKRSAYQQFMTRAEKRVIPLERAVQIVQNADQYPAFLVAAAESRSGQENISEENHSCWASRGKRAVVCRLGQN